MNPELEHPSDPTAHAVGRVEIAISTLLRAGVITSLAIIFIGMALSYVHNRDAVRDPSKLIALTATDAPVPDSLHKVASGVRHLRGQAVIALGLLILIATPVMRVAVSIVAFAVQHDSTYVLITSIVLALLMLSFILGHSGE